MRTLVALTMLAILLIPTLSPAYKTIRNGNGDLIGTETRVGHRTEFRDRDNNLKAESNRQGSRTIIRNGEGDQIGEVGRGNDD